MCKCTPELRTPFCGKPGCEWPKPQTVPPGYDVIGDTPLREQITQAVNAALQPFLHKLPGVELLALMGNMTGQTAALVSLQVRDLPIEVAIDTATVNVREGAIMTMTSIAKAGGLEAWAGLIRGQSN